MITIGKCPLCKQEEVPLLEHHYPKLKSKGGKKIMKVCLNCHYFVHSKFFQIIDLREKPIGVIEAEKLCRKK